jgi:hypothetical protein
VPARPGAPNTEWTKEEGASKRDAPSPKALRTKSTHEQNVETNQRRNVQHTSGHLAALSGLEFVHVDDDDFKTEELKEIVEGTFHGGGGF